MKKIIRYTLLVVAVYLVLWIMGSFIVMEHDVTQWDSIGRLILVTVGSGIILTTISIIESNG